MQTTLAAMQQEPLHSTAPPFLPQVHKQTKSRAVKALHFDPVCDSRRLQEGYGWHRLKSQRATVTSASGQESGVQIAYDEREHFDALRTSQTWSAALLQDGSMQVEVVKRADLPHCIIRLAMTRLEVLKQSIALDLELHFEEFGPLMLDPDGSSFRTIRLWAQSSPEELLHDTNARKCRTLTVGVTSQSSISLRCLFREEGIQMHRSLQLHV